MVDISYYKFPSDKQRRSNMAGEDQAIEYAANAIQLCLQWPFFAKLFKFNIRFLITGQKRKHRLKDDAEQFEIDFGHDAKKDHDYQAKITLNGEDMNKLVSTIFYALWFTMHKDISSSNYGKYN